VLPLFVKNRHKDMVKKRIKTIGKFSEEYDCRVLKYKKVENLRCCNWQEFLIFIHKIFIIGF